MTEKSFPRLQERYFESVLPNGLTVRVLEKPEFDKTYAVLAVHYGSVDTEFEYRGVRHRVPDGVAHFLEHKTFDLPEGNAMDIFHAIGGSPNAFTSYDMTAYYLQATEHAEENLQALLQMVFTPFFTAQSVEKERGIIAEEIKMYADNADSQVYERLFAVMFPPHPICSPIAGSLESIAQISEQTLQLCYDAFYRPDNMILCVEGKLRADTVLRIAQNATPQAPPERAVRVLPQTIPLQRKKTRRTMDVSRPTFTASVRLPDLAPADAKTELVCELAAEILAGESSRCYRELYEGGLIDTGFFAGFESVRSLAMMSFGGDSDDPQAVFDAVFAEAERLRSEGIDKSEFERLKKSALGRRLRELDSFSATCNRICGYYFDGIEYLDFPAVLDGVTESDVLQHLNYIRPERACISLIEPRQEEEETI